MKALQGGALPKPPPYKLDEVVLPRNEEAERAILGSALLAAATADYVVDKLEPEDFFRRAHQQLFDAMRTLRHQNVAVDLIPLMEELRRRKKLDEVGGPAYITGLADGVSRSTNIPHYVEIVRDLHVKRSLYDFAKYTIDLVAENAHAAEQLVIDTDRRLMGLQGGHLEGRMLPLSATTGQIMEDLEWRVAHKGELLGLETGFQAVNEVTFGWQAGDLIVIGARPSIGKTAFVLNTALAAARCLHETGKGHAIAIFSLEMRRRQLEYRLLSSLSGIPLSRLLSGYIAQSEYAKLSAAQDVMHKVPIEIDDQAGLTRWQIRSACRRVKAMRGLAMVVVDYVQLVQGSLDRRGANRNEEVTDISRGMKVLADELSVPVVLLSQLSRPNTKHGDPKPKLSDLRESGALEQDADVVAFLHRKSHREGGPTQFIIEKQRNGATGTVLLDLDRDTTTFTDHVPEPEPAEAPPKAKRAEHDR